MYEGWHPNPDGTIDIWFGYLNQNWEKRPGNKAPVLTVEGEKQRTVKVGESIELAFAVTP